MLNLHMQYGDNQKFPLVNPLSGTAAFCQFVSFTLANTRQFYSTRGDLLEAC